MTERTQAPEVGLDLDGDPVEVLQAVWREALEVEEVDPDAGFFDLGATSVVILRVVHVLRERWPGLRVVDVFSHPTVTELAAFLDDE
ncbi:phosphopantetheine-binding protein [Micromonospora sp. WMMD718]|uniref:phosphopantetheine-binding protein n=1 Tax=Micromonospora TaxID=1873 RepID=UPI00064BFE11|nr:MULTISPECIES: phosphopantetheine-binding protein [unclassified Micromonospora]MDG4755831.1 phosphopantetheine-binding protein [Micromonospora sp. WMMD718]